MQDKNLNRRRFLLGLAVAGPAGSLVVSSGALAEDMPVLSMQDPLAVGLQYVEAAVDSESPTYQPGQTCANCLQIKGNEGDAFRPCAIIPGKKVNSLGWCSAWVAKP
jgi:hypothetical protein